MRLAVFSDIHANLPALEAFAAKTRGEVDGYLCLGDIVNYGPWNDECLELVFSLPNLTVVEGNHERIFRGVEDPNHEIPLVQDFYRVSIQRFSRHDLIEDLPVAREIAGFCCTHTIDDRRIYADTQVEVDRDYLIGHSHHAYDIARGNFRIVNPGSLGQNRKRLDQASYAILDVKGRNIAFQQLDYPWETLLQEMRHLKYPQACIDYYLSKLPK